MNPQVGTSGKIARYFHRLDASSWFSISARYEFIAIVSRLGASFRRFAIPHKLNIPAIRLVLLAILCGTLSACSSRLDGMVQTAKAMFQSNADISNTTLNPSVRYLRVVIDGRVLLLALGYVDADRLGPVEVWYSAKGEVLRLQNGHIVGLTGTDDEWRQVRMSTMPAWPTAPTATAYTRIRDVMPGYRFSILDRLLLRPVAAPVKSNLVALNAPDLRWFEEVEEDAKLPTAHFALASIRSVDVVVYGEQCISNALCLSWQQWPAVQLQ